MSDCLKLNKSNCKNCYKCIRYCPVKSIKFSEHQANIIPDECILCGECYRVCPQSAKEIRNDVLTAKKLVSGFAPVYVSVAPSFIANYPGVGIEALTDALKALGFDGAEETAIGATIVKNEYDRLVTEADDAPIISSCCHSVNLLIQKHYPDALKYLAHTVSPMLAHSMDIKRRYPDAKTVFIGPCISKKEEAETYSGIVDCVLTFGELTGWLLERGIALEKTVDKNQETRARLFPTAGGVLRTMDRPNKDYSYITIDGVDACKETLEDICRGKLRKCFIEMSACVGSCVGGPAMENRGSAGNQVLVAQYAGKKNFPVEQPKPEKLAKDMPVLAPKEINIGKAAIDDVLRQIGKTLPEHELNCGCCGYDTCREKAKAVLLGKANLTMCLPYLKDKAESFSDMIIKNTLNSIVVLNEEMAVEQINGAAQKLMNIQDPHDVLHEQVVRILNPTIFMHVRETGVNVYNDPVYLPEYKKFVEQTVIYDKNYHIIICIMRDVTEAAHAREERDSLTRTAIELTDKIIDKQMRSVQEIASLLGESTAETKVALTKLKESLSCD